MNENGQYPVKVARIIGVAFCTRNAHNHGIDRLQMGRVGRNIHLHRLLVGQGALRRIPQVVLYVSVKIILCKFLPLKFRENLRSRLAKHIGQHIESTPVCHAQNHFFHTQFRAALQHEIQTWNQGLCALNGEALLADKLGVQKGFKGNGFIELVQNVPLFRLAEYGVVVVGVDKGLYPLNHFRLTHVHILHANRAAVNGLQVGHNLAQRRWPWQAHLHGGLENRVQVRRAKSEILQIQGGAVRPALTNWVGLRKQVPTRPIAID